MESLYELIHRALTSEGMLPKGFSLPKPNAEKIHFADGAMDGIAIFIRPTVHKAWNCWNRLYVPQTGMTQAGPGSW